MKNGISPDLLHLAKPIEFFFESPSNANTHPTASLHKLAESYREFGQLKPIVARSDGEVIAGNGSFVAIRDVLKWDKIAANIVDLDDETALAYAIADNRTADLSEWNYKKVEETLKIFKNKHAGIDAEFMAEVNKKLSANKRELLTEPPEVDLSEFTIPHEKTEGVSLRYKIECGTDFMVTKSEIDAALEGLGLDFEVKIDK